MEETRTINISNEVQDDAVIHVLNFIQRGWRVSFMKSLGGIYYGNHPSNSDDYRLIIPRNEKGIINCDLKVVGNRLNVDVFSAIFRLLTDEVNKGNPGMLDTHHRVRFEKSYQNENGIASMALVDRLVNGLLGLLEKDNTARGWMPAGKTFAIGLSHDVDNPMKYAILSSPLFYQGASVQDLKYIVKKKVKGVARFFHDSDPNNYWIFDKVMDAETRHGFKSTSYFAVTPYYGLYGARRDVPYDAQHPKFKRVFESMNERGFEIGLHAGYHTFKGTERFLYEKELLERLANTRVQGLRHHYWHLGAETERTLHMHHEAGFLYDSSIGFNDHMGFRRSVATPYLPWSHESNSEINTLQLPVFCMDGNLFKKTKDVDVAMVEFERYLDEIEAVGGIGMIDWHTRTSFPANKQYREWGEGYLRILELLASKKNAWVTSGVEIAEAFLKKN